MMILMTFLVPILFGFPPKKVLAMQYVSKEIGYNISQFLSLVLLGTSELCTQILEKSTVSIFHSI